MPLPLKARINVPPLILKSVAVKTGRVLATKFQVPLPNVKILEFIAAAWVTVPVVFKVTLDVVVRPVVLTVPIDQLAALFLRFTVPVLPATVVMLLLELSRVKVAPVPSSSRPEVVILLTIGLVEFV